MISVIIITYNEEILIQSIIDELNKQQFKNSFEILLADGGSSDNTLSIAERNNVKVIRCRKGKANQMNDAVKVARGNILFFVHVDMKFSKHVLSVIKEQIDSGYDGGGFSNEFDQYNDKIKNLGTWMNFRFLDKREQSDKGIFYGDNGIFVKKEVFKKLGGFKEIPIMEDYDFSVRLKKNFKIVNIKDPKIIVSARRHIKAGFLTTRFQWIMIRKLYKWGVKPEKLANWYKDIR